MENFCQWRFICEKRKKKVGKFFEIIYSEIVQSVVRKISKQKSKEKCDNKQKQVISEWIISRTLSLHMERKINQLLKLNYIVTTLKLQKKNFLLFNFSLYFVPGQTHNFLLIFIWKKYLQDFLEEEKYIAEIKSKMKKKM